MSNIVSSVKIFVRSHVKTSIAIALVLVFGGYYTLKSLTNTTGQTSYVLGTVTKNTIVASITGSGQVAANRQLDLKPTVSGNVVYIGAAQGQTLSAGALIAQLDTTDAEKAVRDAEVGLQSAQLALQKLQEPADALSLLQGQDALAQSNSNLTKAYSDGFDTVSTTFVDLPTIMTGLDNVLHKSDASPTGSGQWNIDYYAGNAGINGDTGKSQQYRNDAEAKYQLARTAYNQAFADYKNLSRTSDTQSIDAIIAETYTTTKDVSDAIQSATNLIQYYQNSLTAIGLTPVAKSDTHLAALATYTTSSNADLTSLLNIQNTITSTGTTIAENTASLEKLKNGPDPLDVQAAQLSITEKQNALQDAKDTLANYYIRAPFNGTLASLTVKNGDPANGGTSIGTFIANEQVATISLNEVDAAKVKIGQKATFTFDAVPDLTLTGKVAAIDTVGTVSQGVVTYTVTISFDSSDDRVKPGMSVSAAIITDVHQDVLTVPSSAVKTSSGGSYVLVFDTPLAAPTGGTGSQGIPSAIPPRQQVVTVGLSDDMNTEIVSGLAEGDQVVTRTIASTTTAAKATAPSILGGGGGGGGAAGAVRRIGG